MLLLLLACTDDPLPVDSEVLPQDTEPEEVIGGDPPILRINEFMASNRRAAVDDSGQASDWVELFNPGEEAVSLDRWTLVVDDEEEELEVLVVEAGGTVLLWLSGSGSLGPAYVGARLPAEGAELRLLDPSGAETDRVLYPQQATDVSAARIPDGEAAWSLSSEPTPGALNEGPVPDTSASGEEGDCGLSSLVEVNYLEGDEVDLTLVCEDNATAELLPVRIPDTATYAEGHLSWLTTAADGGRSDLVFATRQAGAVDEVPRAEVRTIWVADNPNHASPVSPDPLGYSEEWGLPVFHIQTEGSIPESYVPAAISYMGVGYEAEVKVRGASSTSYPKQSYSLAFDEVELAVEGWPSTRDRLVLITTFDDNSYVRQKLVFDQWQAMAEHAGQARLTPRSFFAVVYLDGAYLGLYTAVDHVDDEFLEQMGFERQANLYKAVNHDANFYTKSNLHSGYEKKEGEPIDDFSDLDELVAFTGSSTPTELIDGAAPWLDLQEFMDWFLLVHYSESGDSAGKNSYLFHDPIGGPFRFAPWDFNHAWGQNWYTARIPSSNLNDFSSRNAVFAAIHAVRSDELWDRFRALRADDGPMSTAWLNAQLDGYYALIEPSAERDWAKWAQEYQAFSRWSGHRSGAGDWQDYQGEKAYLYQWVEERGALFDGLY